MTAFVSREFLHQQLNFDLMIISFEFEGDSNGNEVIKPFVMKVRMCFRFSEPKEAKHHRIEFIKDSDKIKAISAAVGSPPHRSSKQEFLSH